MPIFEYNGKKYNVRDEHIDSFMEDFPDASTIMEREGKKYRVKSADYKTFMSEQQQPEQPAPDSTPETPATPTAGETPLTEQDKIRFSANIGQMKRRTEQMMDGFNEQMGTMREYHDNAPLGGGQTAEGKMKFNPESGKLEKTYITPLGNRYTSKGVADMEGFRYRQAADMSVSGQLRRARLKLAELQEKRSKRASEVLDETTEFNKTKLTGLGRALIGGQMYVGMQQGDKENSALDVAIRQTKELIKDLEEQKDREQGVDVGFWRGFGRVAGDVRTWDFGMGDMRDALTMMNADGLKGENATEGEREAYNEMMGALYNKGQAELMYGGNADFWNKAGMMTGHMPAFMLDFGITGGGFNGINVLSKAGTKAATKVVGKETVEQMAEQGFKTYVKNNGVKGLGQYATNWTIKALGTTADDLLLRAPLMTNTVQAGKTTADIIDRKLGDVVVDENGNYDFSNDKTWGNAIWQGEANAIVENATEMGGNVLTLDRLSKFAGVFGAKRISEVLAKANAGTLGGMLGKTNEMFQKVGVGDYLGEVGEEYKGQLWRTMLNLDDAYQQNPDGTRTNLLATGQFHGDIWGGMALSMGLMGAGKATLSGAQYASMKHGVNKADARATELLGKEIWEPLRATIDLTINDDIGSVAEGIVNDKDFSDDERAAVLTYMERSLMMRGFNLGTLAQKRGGEQDEDVQSMDESYIDGYNLADPQEMTDAKNMRDYQRERMKRELGVNDDALAEGAVDWLNEARNAAASGNEQGRKRADIILDYLNAKQVYDGMIQRVRDDIDARVEQSNAMVDARTNRTSGMIQGATMKQDDRRVYVVGGNLVQYADGSGIDNRASDGSIIVRDAETGALEQVSPDAVLNIDEPLNPSDEKMTAEEAIIQQFAQEASDKIDGVVTFNPGDTYTITGDDAQIQVQIVPNEDGIVDNGDGTVNVSDGVNIFPLAKETIQQQADAANLARVAQFEQQRTIENAERKQEIQEADRPQYALNDIISLTDENGVTVRGNITSDADADGRYEVFTEAPINGKRVNLFTRDELDNMLLEHNGVAFERPAENEGNNGMENIPENSNNAPQNIVSADLAIPAMQRIPKDEQGNPLYEQTDSDTAWDAIVEQTEGDEVMAQTVADGMVADKEDALKKLEKAKSKGGNSIAEKIASEKERKAAIDAAKQELFVWQKIAGTANRRKMEADAERRRIADEAAALRKAEEEKLRAEREEAERKEREALNGVPDMVYDKPQDARARGYRRMNGHKIDRQEKLTDLSERELPLSTLNSGFNEELRRYREGAMDSNEMFHLGGPQGVMRMFLPDLPIVMRQRILNKGSVRKHNVAIEALADMPIHLSHPIFVFKRSDNALGVLTDMQDRDGKNVCVAIELKRQIQDGGEILEVNDIRSVHGRNVADIVYPIVQNGTLEWVDKEKGLAYLSSASRYVQQEIDKQDLINATKVVENFENPKVEGGKVERDSGRSGVESEDRGNQEKENDETEVIGRSMTADEAQDFIADMELSAEIAPEIDLTIENWDALFGEYGIVSTPIGNVKMGENQFTKLMRQGRNGKLGMIKPTLEHPHAIVSDVSEAKEGDTTERASSYVFIRSFKKNDGSRYYYFTSITVSKDGKEVVVSNQEKRRNAIANLLTKGKMVWKHADNVSDASDMAQGLYSPQGNVSDLATEGTDAPQTTMLSDNKDTNNSVKSSELGEKIAKAEAEVDVNPTDKQKEAGNYKKGHVQVGVFDITIEQPKGSVRSGVDANGNKWETTMQNTYGYIRGTEGVDGDHIDVFLSDDIDGWNGRRVFVVDQYNEDGTFDEHKVMLGFNEADEAEAAYFANYDNDWANNHKTVVTAVNLEDFEKWIDSSHRKTKAFAEYKGVNPLRTDHQGNPLNADGSLKVEKVGSVDELTDDDFLHPFRNVELPALPEKVDAAIVANGKPVVIKKNIFEKNKRDHSDVTPSQSREILKSALYTPDLYGQNQKAKRPYNWVVVNTKDEEGHNRIVLLEVNNNKYNVEIVHWHYLDDRGIEKIKRQALREDGQLLILPSAETEEVGALSDPTQSLPSAHKGKESVWEKQGDGTESPEAYTITPAQYTTKRGKVLDMQLVTLHDELSKDEFRSANAFAKSLKGWYDAKERGFLMRSEDDARALVETVIQEEDAVAKPEAVETDKKNTSPTGEDIFQMAERIAKEEEAKLETSRHQLQENEISNAPFPEITRDGARSYINGNINFATSIAYQQIYNYVRNRPENSERNRARGHSAQPIVTVADPSGGGSGPDGMPVGKLVGRTGQPGGIKNHKGVDILPVGEGSDTVLRGETSGNDGLPSGSNGRSGSGRTGRDGSDVRKRERESGSGRVVGENREQEANSSHREIEECLDEIRSLLADFENAGKKSLSLSVVGMNAEQIEIAGKILVAGVRLGYTYVRTGITKFGEWTKAMRGKLASPLSASMKLTDAEIDEFITDMWEYPHTVDGETRLLKDWASVLEKEKLRQNIAMTLEEKRKAQQAAEPIPVKTGDLGNIAQTLPFLLPQQQDDVMKAETQFFDESHNDREHAFGKGYMFTNGTGTGKTYTGLGIVKRFVKQGKGRILILTPSQQKVKDWVKDAANLGIELNDLGKVAKARNDGTTATTEKGEGAVITTYANFRQNKALLEDRFDLIVYDESHRLLENKEGAGTTGALQHYKISNRNENYAYLRLQEINPTWKDHKVKTEEFETKRNAVIERLKKESGLTNELALGQRFDLPPVLNGHWTEETERKFPELSGLRKEALALYEKFQKEVKPELERQAKEDVKHTKVVFLSATPFNTRENLDYAEGYIFSYPEREKQDVYGAQSPRSQFYLEHFGAGYRWRYHRLESSGSNPEAVSKQEVEFSDYLQHTLGTMSGRIIDSPFDYSRDFPTVTLEKAEEFNAAMEELSHEEATRGGYYEVMGNYNYSSALFESMKVSQIIPRLRGHLSRGRKAVIFHRRMESKKPLVPPFKAIFDESVKALEKEYDANKKAEKKRKIAFLRRKYAGMLEWEQGLDLRMPREQLADAFGKDEVVFFSGQESEKVKNKAVSDFNSDDSGKDIIVIQENSGKEGISLHDTTGRHQRVLVTLALPQSPITALQIEGRIYRIGNKSNAIFEYPLLGLNAELMLFGQKFNQQVSTTENLALGSQARNLRESFARGVEEHSGEVDPDRQGVGGKEFDAPVPMEGDAFDRAVLDYYTNQKLTGRRDNREGKDYYPTPEPLGFMMAQWGRISEGESVLEPSAGHGAIARYVPRENPLTAIEPSQSLFGKLQLKAGGNGRRFENGVFEDYNVVNKHDVVLMNPPFGTGGRLAVDHVAKAFQHLEEGGRIVAIIPRGSTDKKFDQWYEGQKDAVVTAEIGLPDITFERAGTSVNCRVVVIDKVGNETLRQHAASRAEHIDLSGEHYEKIEDFFEEIRDINVPERTIDRKAKLKKKSSAAARELRTVKGVNHVVLNEDGISVSGRGVWAEIEWGERQGEELTSYLAGRYRAFKSNYDYAVRGERATNEAVYGELKALACKLAGMTEDEMQRYIDRSGKSDDVLYRNDEVKKGNLTAKTFYKTKKGSDQRVIDLERSLLLTSKTSLVHPLSDAKIPQMFENPSVSDENLREGEGALTDDEVSYENDPAAKLLGRSGRTAKQRREFAQRERQRMTERVKSLAGNLHLDNVEIVTDASTLEGKKQRAKGFYSKSTGKITIVVPNHSSVFDIEQTLLHEAVAHYGLRQLFGEHFDTFLDNVFNNAEESIRRRIMDIRKQLYRQYAQNAIKGVTSVFEHAEIIAHLPKNESDFTHTATEEYLASLAENTEFENTNASWWREIKELFLRMLHKIGFEGFSGVTLSDNELRYILWRSYENLAEPGRYRSILGEAADVAKQAELKVGNYTSKPSPTDSEVAEAGELEEVNERFNEELSGLTEENADKVVLSLGRPSAVLLSAGVSDKPMKLYGNKVVKKMKKHGFALDELQDLPRAVANPIAVFENYGKEDNRSVLTELHTEQGNFLVTLSIGQGHDIDFNIVTSVFGKGKDNIIDWFNRGFATYVDKQKTLDYLHHSALKAVTSNNRERGKALNKLHFSGSSIPEVSDNAELSRAAKIVESFENPKVSDGKTRLSGVSEAGEVEEVNERFNEELEQQIEGKLPDGHIYEMGHPGNVLLSTGVPDLPIQMNAKRLQAKATSYGHDFDLSEVKDLVKALQHPLAVFAYGNKSKAQNIIVPLQNDGKNFIVGLSLNPVVGGRKLEINSIRNVFPKHNSEWLNWISQGKALYLDKEKIQTLINQQRTILADVDYLNLDSVTKVVENFENPVISHENISEDDALYRDGDPERHERELARDRYERRVKSGMFQSQEALQDSMLGLKEAMTAILGKRTYIEDVDGFENAYLGENRLSSVNKAEADAFAHLLFKPMLDEVAKLARTEAEREELTDYMMAKHGLERNTYMRNEAIHNGATDAGQTDYAGLTALTGMDNVADAEAEAQRMVDAYEQAHDTTALWKKVNAVSKAILSKSYECGMMSKATFDKVSAMYEFYIPLRGFDEKTSSEAYAYLTHKQSAFNAPIKKAEGRRSKADDPFANLQSMAEGVIMQGNRNKLVKQRFLNFALNHPSDLVSVSDIWVEHDAVANEWKPVFPDNIDSTDTPEEVERKMQDFETKMESLAQQYPDRYKHGKDTVNIPYRIVESRDLRQHQIVVKRGGRDYVITINGNPRAAQAVNGQTNPDNDMSGAIGAILRAGENINRQLSAFYTTRNPDFIVSNFIRDMLYTNTMVWIKESPNYALRFHRNYMYANPVRIKQLLAKHRKGMLDMSDKTEAMFHQFMMNGGETGYANIRDIEQHKNDIRRELKKSNGKIPVKKAWDLLGERFDEYNRAVENCARFAAFMTSREMGRSIDRAIYDAKEISVNFNKKGSGAKFYGSTGQTKVGNASALVSGLGRSGYVFWNAAIQGTANFGRQMKRHPAKAFTGIAAMFILGAIVAYLGGDDDDDDDKNAYYNLPEHVRRSNILFRAGGSWVSIPLPVEYRAFYGMGELMVSVLNGKEHLTGGEIAEAIAGQATQILPIDFLEGGGGVNAFVPSAYKPLWEAYVAEKSWTGMPLYKDTPWNKDMPEWTKAYKSANKYIVGLANVMNEATGGDPYTKGAIDINPAKIEYMLNGYFGGVFGTIDKLSKTAETIAGDREYDPRSLLLVNRLVKAGDERTEYRAVNNEYFRLKEEHDRLKSRLKHYEEDTDNGIFDYAEKIDFLYNSPDYERYEIFEDYREDIDDLYNESKEAISDEERKDIEAELNELKKEMIEEMNLTRKRK